MKSLTSYESGSLAPSDRLAPMSRLSISYRGRKAGGTDVYKLLSKKAASI
jgi:hypothetical protein